MNVRTAVQYYPGVLGRRLGHYLDKRAAGYTDRGPLEEVAPALVRARANRGFRAGSHFSGLWPRDLCFAAVGITELGFANELREAADIAIERLDDTFYTDFHASFEVATPAEGVDTFPALVILLHEADGLTERAEALASLAALHRDRFFDEDLAIVTGHGSSWWDSAADPREAYNTAMLLAALERLEACGVDTVYAGDLSAIRDGFRTAFWNGAYLNETRQSEVLACDANVVALYFGLLSPEEASAVIGSLAELQTEHGLKLREQPFARSDVRPAFRLHPDYHYHIWPWNSYMYAIGARRYGEHGAAASEIERIERVLRHYGNFLEVVTLDGRPYVKRGYASAEDFTVAAGLWLEYHRGRSDNAG